MDLLVMDLRQTMEADKQKCLADLKKQMELERQKSVAETKKKQWCANCGKEAIFYCCWNTSYCDYPCQVSLLFPLPIFFSLFIRTMINDQKVVLQFTLMRPSSS
jgi:hypothetical protein